MTKLRYFGVAAAAVLLGVLCWAIPGQAGASIGATARALGGPGTTQQPGPYYNSGDLVGICVGVVPGASTYVEIHTNFGTSSSPNPNALGNCAAGRVQLVVGAVPPGFDVQGPVPSPSASGL